MQIIEDKLTSEPVKALLREHLDGMARHSPPGCVHALDLPALRADDITFWTAWDKMALLGCGALKELDSRHGEVKSMRTAKSHLRRGVAGALLRHIIDQARMRNYSRLSLETGSGEAFVPAAVLYAKFGFEYCGPFGDYRADPFSRFMTLEL